MMTRMMTAMMTPMMIAMEVVMRPSRKRRRLPSEKSGLGGRGLPERVAGGRTAARGKGRRRGSPNVGALGIAGDSQIFYVGLFCATFLFF